MNVHVPFRRHNEVRQEVQNFPFTRHGIHT